MKLKPGGKAPAIRLSPRKRCRISYSESVNFEIERKATCDKAVQVDGVMNSNLLAEKMEPVAAVDSLKAEIKNNTTNKFVEHVLSSDKLCKHYTSFPSTNILNCVFDLIDPGVNGENIVLINSKLSNKNKACGRKRLFTPMEALVLTLVRLRRNFDITHLMYLFDATWINIMYIYKIGSIVYMAIIRTSSEFYARIYSMKEKYPNVKCIIDCVEFKVATPSSLFLHKMLYSDYKSHTTVKALVGIAPGGGFTFISAIYPGSISDRSIVVKCGFLNPDLWVKGDAVMADRGFTIEDYLTPLGVSL